MKELFQKLEGKYQKVLEGGSLLGILLKTYKEQNNPIIVKMRDENGDFKRGYRASDILSKGYAFSLIHKKLEAHNVAYISDNHVDIMGVDMGCWMNKKYTTGFYKNDSIEHISFKIIDSDVDILILNQAGLEKASSLPLDIKKGFKKVFLVEGTKEPEGHGFPFLEKLELPTDESVISKIPTPDPEKEQNNVFKVVYTSGSTGTPKGVPITNKNSIYSGFGFLKNMFEGAKEREVCPFFLPNAHIFQTSIFALSYMGLFQGHITTKDTFLEDLPKIQPTYMFGVPLLFQTLAHGVEEKLTKMLGGFFKEKDLVSPTWKNRLFIKPILSKAIKKKLGFSRLKNILSGGAALNGKTYDIFLHTFGIKIVEAYGMSETTCTLTFDRFGKKGSCGKRAACNEIEIREKDKSGIGDIWVRGNNVFDGYLNFGKQNNFDKDGWFKTGDRGIFDEDGYLFLKGRSKNFLKAADGRFYNIEFIAEKVLDKSNHIQQVVAHILNSPTPIGLITLGEEADGYFEDITNLQLLEDLYKECFFIIEELEREKFYPIPKKFIFVPPFTEESGFLTPTKKTKPLTVLTHYESQLNDIQNREESFLFFLTKEKKLKGFRP